MHITLCNKLSLTNEPCKAKLILFLDKTMLIMYMFETRSNHRSDVSEANLHAIITGYNLFTYQTPCL